MEHYQQAALSLHGMSDTDQRWLLEKLPPGQRNRLQLMLDELVQLGVPAEPVLLERAAAGIDSIPINPLLQRLVCYDPRRIGEVLAQEPTTLAVALLSCREWPWKKAVLSSLQTLTRTSIEQALQNEPRALTEKAKAALYAAMLAELDLLPTRSTANETIHTTRRWRLLEKLSWRK